MIIKIILRKKSILKLFYFKILNLFYNSFQEDLE